jgi:hypothetical protein
MLKPTHYLTCCKPYLMLSNSETVLTDKSAQPPYCSPEGPLKPAVMAFEILYVEVWTSGTVS